MTIIGQNICNQVAFVVNISKLLFLYSVLFLCSTLILNVYLNGSRFQRMYMDDWYTCFFAHIVMNRPVWQTGDGNQNIDSIKNVGGSMPRFSHSIKFLIHFFGHSSVLPLNKPYTFKEG